MPAVAISQVSPKYPEFALRTRTSASVVLELEIDKQGKGRQSDSGERS